MKATGIVRRIDDLGRVVIPREIRKVIGIREGDPLEIYTVDGGVVFKKCEHDFAHEAEHLRDLVEEYMDEDDPVKTQTLIALEKVASLLRRERK